MKITIAIANQRDKIDIAIMISIPLHTRLPDAKKLNRLHINSDILIKQIVCRNMKRQLPIIVAYIQPLCRVSVCDMGITKVAAMMVTISKSLKNVTVSSQSCEGDPHDLRILRTKVANWPPVTPRGNWRDGIWGEWEGQNSPTGH